MKFVNRAAALVLIICGTVLCAIGIQTTARQVLLNRPEIGLVQVDPSEQIMLTKLLTAQSAQNEAYVRVIAQQQLKIIMLKQEVRELQASFLPLDLGPEIPIK